MGKISLIYFFSLILTLEEIYLDDFCYPSLVGLYLVQLLIITSARLIILLIWIVHWLTYFGIEFRLNLWRELNSFIRRIFDIKLKTFIWNTILVVNWFDFFRFRCNFLRFPLSMLILHLEGKDIHIIPLLNLRGLLFVLSSSGFLIDFKVTL